MKPFDGSCDHRDIRTFYRSELAYLRAMRRRYACAICGDKAEMCSSCSSLDERIEELERKEHDQGLKTFFAPPSRSLLAGRCP